MPEFNQALIVRSDAPATHVREDELFRTSVVAVTDVEGAVAAARRLRDEGVQLIELYGGFGPTAAAAVFAATGGEIPVGAVGFEERGGGGRRAALVELLGADPARDRWELGAMTMVGVGDRDAVPAVAAELAAAGAERIELCGGLGVEPAAATLAAVGDRAQVAPVLFGFESLPGAAAFRARFEALVS